MSSFLNKTLEFLYF